MVGSAKKQQKQQQEGAEAPRSFPNTSLPLQDSGKSVYYTLFPVLSSGELSVLVQQLRTRSYTYYSSSLYHQLPVFQNIQDSLLSVTNLTGLFLLVLLCTSHSFLLLVLSTSVLLFLEDYRDSGLFLVLWISSILDLHPLVSLSLGTTGNVLLALGIQLLLNSSSPLGLRPTTGLLLIALRELCPLSPVLFYIGAVSGLILGNLIFTQSRNRVVIGTNNRKRKSEVYECLPNVIIFPPPATTSKVLGSPAATATTESATSQFPQAEIQPRRKAESEIISGTISLGMLGTSGLNHSKMRRRTSLPAALPLSSQGRQAIHHGGSTGVDTALLLEAHGLVTDMLLDHAALPAHIVAGLKALATLLTPPQPALHYPSPRPRPAPLTLSTDPDYTSDIDEIPYTGEKISAMPKRNSLAFKKGVSANLLRRMSTSTWTTTTSATGMPTLEPQPNSRRRRSASFRSAMEGTAGGSPTQHSGLVMAMERCGDPIGHGTSHVMCRGHSTDLPPTYYPTQQHYYQPLSHLQHHHHHAPALQASHKSRSFSANVLCASSDVQRRFSHQEGSTTQRKTVCSLHPLSPSDLSHLSSLAHGRGGSSPGTPRNGSPNISPCNTPGHSPLPSPHPSRDPSPAKFPIPSPQSQTSARNIPSNLPTNLSSDEVTPGEIDLGRLSTVNFVQDNPEEDNYSTTSTLGDGPGPPSFGGSSSRLSPVIFTVQEPSDDPHSSASTDDESGHAVITEDGTRFDLLSIQSDPHLCRLGEWDFPIFDLDETTHDHILSHMCYKIFSEVGLFETFRIPTFEFMNYFHSLEMGYREKPYHNRMHAADVLHGVYYLTSQPIPGFEMQLSDPETPCAPEGLGHQQRACFNVEESSYGIMGANFPALELMALYTAAAMHDYDHPGRTNAFLVTTHAPQAILYNDRSVLENHHAAAAWSLLMSSDSCNFLKFLDKAEFKRFRYLVIEAILATDLKRHFEILAEFNSKVNEEDSAGIDWNLEADRLLVMEMCIKLADINGPCKFHDIHVRWTYRIAEEFYEQGDEEAELGLPISPYMDRDHPQLAKLQESFINHLVAPLCKAVAEAGILPGYWEDEEEGDENLSSCHETDNENESSYSDDPSSMNEPSSSATRKAKRKIFCVQTKHLQDNHRHWMAVIKEESRKKDEGVKTESVAISTEDPMETIEEENNTPHSLSRSFSFEKEDSKL